LRKNKEKKEMKNQYVGMGFFHHQFSILRKGGKGKGENQTVGVL